MTPADLKAAREALGLSQNGLAERLGVSQSTVSRWEAGLMPIERPAMLRLALERLAEPRYGPLAGKYLWNAGRVRTEDRSQTRSSA